MAPPGCEWVADRNGEFCARILEGMYGLITLVLRNEGRPLRGAAIEVDRNGLPHERIARGAGFSGEPLQSLRSNVVDVDVEVHDGEYNCLCSYVQRATT